MGTARINEHGFNARHLNPPEGQTSQRGYRIG